MLAMLSDAANNAAPDGSNGNKHTMQFKDPLKSLKLIAKAAKKLDENDAAGIKHPIALLNLIGMLAERTANIEGENKLEKIEHPIRLLNAIAAARKKSGKPDQGIANPAILLKLIGANSKNLQDAKYIKHPLALIDLIADIADTAEKNKEDDEYQNIKHPVVMFHIFDAAAREAEKMKFGSKEKPLSIKHPAALLRLIEFAAKDALKEGFKSDHPTGGLKFFAYFVHTAQKEEKDFSLKLKHPDGFFNLLRNAAKEAGKTGLDKVEFEYPECVLKLIRNIMSRFSDKQCKKLLSDSRFVALISHLSDAAKKPNYM